MALLVCRKCSTRFSVGARFCPQCTAEDAYIEGTEEEVMPRNTVAGASLGVQHPDYVEGGPVPPIVPEGVALDAPIADQLAALESTTTDEPDGDDTDDSADDAATTDEPAKKAPAKKAAAKAASK